MPEGLRAAAADALFFGGSSCPWLLLIIVNLWTWTIAALLCYSKTLLPFFLDVFHSVFFSVLLHFSSNARSSLFFSRIPTPILCSHPLTDTLLSVRPAFQPIYATLSDIVVYSPTGKGLTRAAFALAEKFKQAIEAKAAARAAAHASSDSHAWAADSNASTTTTTTTKTTTTTTTTTETGGEVEGEAPALERLTSS